MTTSLTQPIDSSLTPTDRITTSNIFLNTLFERKMKRSRQRIAGQNGLKMPLRATLAASCLTFLLQSSGVSSSAPSLADFPSPYSFLQNDHFLQGGQIHEDVKCDIEQLEDANDSQLHLILQELVTTSLFRSFSVDLDEKCPLAMWQPEKKKKKEAAKTTDTPAKNEEGDSETEECASEGLPDMDPDTEPACSLNTGGDSTLPWAAGATSVGFGGGFSGSNFASSSLPVSTMPEKEVVNDTDDGDEEEPGCPSENSDELDPDAPSLCTLATDENGSNPFGASTSFTPHAFSSTALHHITERSGGWESESEKQTFSWSTPSDPVVTIDDEPCDDQQDGSLPDTFWVDMCSNIKSGAGMKVVNLQLNPERNTGYNGTHIWNAIYEENCINLDGSSSTPMCYEEQVLYRLLSGMHAATTLSIAKHYYPPSKRKGRTNWKANPDFFMEKFGDHPDYIRNLHFSYVVLLRALRKSSSFLYDYDIRTGNIVEDETSQFLLQRLLGSTILRSCHDVFTAFDESLMFKEREAHEFNSDVISLQENFKGVFHNISSVLDCVQCQQCKLHGKMTMLGYGTALKILFLPREELIPAALSRNEVVAFINTIAKFSEALKEVRELTSMYWVSKIESTKHLPPPVQVFDEEEAENTVIIDTDLTGIEIVDSLVGVVSSLAQQGHINDQIEAELIKRAFSRDPDLMVLAKHYASAPHKFLDYLEYLGIEKEEDEPDVIIIGSGLAGLSAALNLLDRGGKVVILEKEHRLGGNSNKASSGINALCPSEGPCDDEFESFRNDTIRSAGDAAQIPLIQTLVGNSGEAVTWLRNRVGVDLSLLAQLGGHSHKRTHRPSNGMAGAEIIYGVQKRVREYEASGMVQILVDTKVTKLLTDDNGRVFGVEAQKNEQGETLTMTAPNVVLATGGFAADRSNGSYLSHYRPELLRMPATAGDFSTGDGIGLAEALGAGTVDMDKVQIHPTGWVDPSDPDNRSKILAAELMRGVGGILINSDGKRFCNELGTRAYVTDRMLSHDANYNATKKWNEASQVPTFSLVLSSSAALDGKKHVDLYTHKGLLTRIEGVTALAEWIGQDVSVVRSTIETYQREAQIGVDTWGKTSFRGVPNVDLDNETFYAGTVTPVLHYCMGGVTIDAEGNVLDREKKIIQGLHAAGEVSGGVHGNNRLGGNSLLECTVYGTIIGKKLPVKNRKTQSNTNGETSTRSGKTDANNLREITPEELAMHNTEDDCWVSIHGSIYDLTDFAEEHPPGAQSIIDLAGMDGTEAFESVHNENILEDFEDVKIGFLKQ
mmetsp:Transcript_9636/g.14274  ORF Transcript_9636/g.14274 Transcript_9636/m.14274 type:complete len:1290 (+) Transcript_9636:112-3981(+)